MKCDISSVEKGPGIKRKTVLFILGIAGFIVMADNWVVSSILPVIAKDLSIPVLSTGILITAYMLPFGLCQLIFGPLSDRFGKRQILSFAMLFFSVGTALTATGQSLGFMILFRAITGIFAASVMPISMALISDLVPIEERQSALGFFLGMAFLGQSMSMVIGGTIAFYLNWRSVFLLYAIFAAFITLLFFTTGRKIPSSRNSESRFLAPYIELLKNSQSRVVYILVLCEGILIIGSFSFLGSFIENFFKFNSLIIGFIMTAFGITAMIGGRLSGKIAARIGQRRIIAIGFAIAALADSIFYCCNNVLWLLVIGVALLGLGLMLAHSTLLTKATQFAEKSRGVAMSLIAFCFMGGGGIGTAIGSNLIKAYGYADFYLFCGIALLILIIPTSLLIKTNIKNQLLS